MKWKKILNQEENRFETASSENKFNVASSALSQLEESGNTNQMCRTKREVSWQLAREENKNKNCSNIYHNFIANTNSFN